MNISKSKQKLASIISENGGWRDGAEWAIQHGTGRIAFTKSTKKPIWEKGNAGWGGSFFFGGFSFRKLQQHHQNALSRAEYFHLYPTQDADGWIEWNGGECPVDGDCIVSYKMRDAATFKRGEPASEVRWAHNGVASDVIAYRPHKPERVNSTAVGDDETNLAAKEELEAMEYKPSIEQLMQTYTDRAHSVQLANEHLATCTKQASEAMEALSVACKAAGFDISPITEKQEPELVITELRDLRVGDEVELIKKNGGHAKVGEIGLIKILNGRGGIWVNFPSQNDYIVGFDHIKFIRRP